MHPLTRRQQRDARVRRAHQRRSRRVRVAVKFDRRHTELGVKFAGQRLPGFRRRSGGSARRRRQARCLSCLCASRSAQAGAIRRQSAFGGEAWMRPLRRARWWQTWRWSSFQGWMCEYGSLMPHQEAAWPLCADGVEPPIASPWNRRLALAASASCGADRCHGRRSGARARPRRARGRARPASRATWRAKRIAVCSSDVNAST